MSAGLPVPPLELVGSEVPLRDIEKEISMQMRATMPGDVEEAPVQRVRMSNLVVSCDSDECARVEAVRDMEV